MSPPAGLYVHIPFCASLCGYCDFARELAQDGAVPEWFDAALLAEAERYREDPPIPIDTVYFGGGTPSLLPPARLLALLGRFAEVFSVSSGAEVTLEANPESVTADALRRWRDAGVNRLSLGVQSLDARELSLLDRRASAERARHAVALAASAGFTRLSADVMVGIPGQSAASLAATLDEMASWPLDHLSGYLLDAHEGTPLHGRLLRRELSLPGEDESADLYGLLCDRALAGRFRQYEVSNFGRPGGESRHNLKYWRGEETLGLGPSAHGAFRGTRTVNLRAPAAWRDALARGGEPFETTSRITPHERIENRVLFGLRLTEGVEEETVQGFLTASGREPTAALAPLLDHRYMERTETGRLRLTREGFLASTELLAYLLPDGWRAEGEGRGEKGWKDEG